MSRAKAIEFADASFGSGRLKDELARLIAMPTESQNPERIEVLASYLTKEMMPRLAALGFSTRLLAHPKAKTPFLLAERIEDKALPTVFGYAHGDVIRGLDKDWRAGLSPWTLTEIDDRWYGRGIADNKGQHLVNLHALEAVLRTRGRTWIQREISDRNGRGTGLARLARTVRGAQVGHVGRHSPELGRPSPVGCTPHSISRHTRRDQLRPDNRGAQRRAPFGKLGRAAVRPGDTACARHLHHRLRDRPDTYSGVGAEGNSRLGPKGTVRLRTRTRPRRSADRSQLGRAGSQSCRAGVWLVFLRCSGFQGGKS